MKNLREFYLCFISLFSSVLSIHRDLQSRLIVSHCAGVGEPLTIERARMMFALRINILAKGYSGISEDTLHKIIAAFNSKKYMYIDIRIFVYLESCIPEIPSQGTVGASGDLAPLAHLAAGICVVRKQIVFFFKCCIRFNGYWTYVVTENRLGKCKRCFRTE
jgi:hypothetical protein